MNRYSVSLRRFLGSVHDIVVAVGVFLLTYLLVLDVPRTLAIPDLWLRISFFALGAGIVFMIFGLNRGAWRYASLHDVAAIVKSSFVLVAGYSVISFLVNRGVSVPRSVPPIMLIFLIFFLSASRLAFRLFRDRQLGLFYKRRRAPLQTQKSVLLYGLTNQAEAFLRALQRSPDVNLRVVGILDDNVANQKLRVHGSKVVGTLSDLNRVVEARRNSGVRIDELAVSHIGLDPKHLSEIVNIAVGAGLTVSMLPDITSPHEVPDQHHLELKPIKLADLLGRPEIQIDAMEVARLINGKKVLVTGAGGSIGSELVRQICGFGPRTLVLTDISEHFLYTIDMEVREAFPNIHIEALVADVRDKTRISRIFERCKPDIVFHAAALKQVPMVEDNPIEAIKTNVLGTQNVADAALASGARAFVMISTDKAVNPTNVMGATKRAAEAYCQMLDLKSDFTRFKTVRFGNVIGSNGSVVPRFKQQIARGGPVTVTHPEIVRFFMTIPEAVRLVLQASSHGLRGSSERGKILVLDMGHPVKIVELATKMIQLAGFRPDIDIKIEFSGLRPGEKLYEELFDHTEIVSPPTGHGYSIATPRVTNDKLLQKTISDMRSAALAHDDVNALKLLLHIVPEYSGTIMEQFEQGDTTRRSPAEPLPWPKTPTD